MGSGCRIPRIPAVLAVCLLLGSCSSATGVELILEDLDRAEALWRATRPATYAAVERRSCECLPSDAGPVLLEIAVQQDPSPDGELIVAATYVNGGGSVPAETLQHFHTAEGLFDLVRRAVEEGAHDVDVAYDPARGYPTFVHVDWDARVADEESTYFFEVGDEG